MIGNNGNGIASSGAIDKGVFNITYIINIMVQSLFLCDFKLTLTK
ncbi:MAG: hypothetical protein PHE29_06000 [Tissierellia bacterium]|nr:hypothetical protein [Tissierellia bacterium]